MLLYKMNRELCLLICFFVGIAVFYLLKQSCGCNVVEGGVDPSFANSPLVPGRECGLGIECPNPLLPICAGGVCLGR